MIIKILLVALISFLANIPLGLWRSHQRRFSLKWFVAVHASVPFIIALRIWLNTDTAYIILFILMAVAGQFVGAKLPCAKINHSCGAK